MATLQLTEEAARDVLLVRAIEVEDETAAILTREDRQYASAAALKANTIDGTPAAREIALFLKSRASIALDRLIARYPRLQRARGLARWPTWLNWALPAAALALGLVTNVIDGSRLNIIAFPLLGMIAWNVAVYVWLILTWLRQSARGDIGHGQPSKLLEWILAPSSAQLAGHPTLERAVTRFGHDWLNVAGPLTRTRAYRTLHVSAATFAAGLLAGMYARARYTVEYTAGWAGTWAGAEAEIAALLKAVLGPASAITNIALPTEERLRELKGAAENAGDWLTLWMVTAAIYVIVPRLLLAFASLLKSERQKRRLRVTHDFYVRRLVRDAVGRARRVRVVPYGFEFTGPMVEKLKRLLVEVLGEKAAIEVDPPVAYGGEDQWLQAHGDGLTSSDQLILLFNLSSTPEEENHGAMVSGVKQLLGNAVELLVLLDDSSFVRRHRGQASAQRRIDERLDAWRAILAADGVEPVRVSIDQSPLSDAARKLEQALVSGTSLA